MKDIRESLGLRRVINVSGTMTSLGASIAVPEAIEAASQILPHFVEIGALQKHASRVIAEVCGSEAGFVTASCSAGLTIAVAGTMTGPDLGAVERLPDTTRLKNEVVIQTGHLINYGAPVDQAIRLAGARIVPVGQSTTGRRYQLESAITEQTAAAVFVISHHAVQYGLIELDEFIEVCHARNVPVIVDAASEYELRRFLAMGADICLYSAHKFMGGITAGIVVGKREHVRHAYLQNIGIGRGMKVGKEGILATAATLQAWVKRDHAADRRRQDANLLCWQQALAGCPGIRADILPDPTGNPLSRLRVQVDPTLAKVSAWDLADLLSQAERPIIVRDDEIDQGYFEMDPCNVHDGEADVVAAILRDVVQAAAQRANPATTSVHQRRNRSAQALLNWPD